MNFIQKLLTLLLSRKDYDDIISPTQRYKATFGFSTAPPKILIATNPNDLKPNGSGTSSWHSYNIIELHKELKNITLSSCAMVTNALYTALRLQQNLSRGLKDSSSNCWLRSAVTTGGLGVRPLIDCFCPLFWFTQNTVFGTSSNDKTTDNDGKRNNYVQTSFSFDVFSILCEIAGNQLLYINLTR